MFKDIAPKGGAKTVKRARELRRTMTLPEILLWQALRKSANGPKFRRQHPSGPFILDFFCGDARLAIEVDGEAHSRGDSPRRDELRDAWLLDAGIATLRIPALEVLGNLEAVLRHINAAAAERLPLHHPAAPGGPPPRDELGEE